LPTSSFEIKPGSIDVSVRFVVESSQNQDANQETDQVFQSAELAQQPLKQVLKILSSRASHIPGEHEIRISSDATSTKIQTKHCRLD
jgi:dihydrodipicolinate reductase